MMCIDLKSLAYEGQEGSFAAGYVSFLPFSGMCVQKISRHSSSSGVLGKHRISASGLLRPR